MPEKDPQAIVSSLARLNTSPAELKTIIHEVWSSLAAPPKEDSEDILKKRNELLERIWQLPVVLRSDESRPFRDVVSDLIDATPSEVLADLEPESFYETFPFRDLGQLPVAPTAAEADRLNATRVQRLFRVVENRAEGARPSRGLDESDRSNTVWLEWSHGWWTCLFYSRYHASTRVTQDGWNAADRVGGIYATAKVLCHSLYQSMGALEEAGEETKSWKMTADFWCNLASSAPRVPWPCYYIKTTVCNCFARGYTGWDFGDHNDCSSNQVSWTAGPVDASYSQGPGSVCAGVGSKHERQLTANQGYKAFEAG